MGKPRRAVPSTPPAAGGAHAWRPSLAYLAVALVLAASGLAYLLLSPPSSDEPRAGAASEATRVASWQASPKDVVAAWPIQATVPLPQEHRMAPDTRPTHEGDNDPTPDLSSYVPRGAKPSMNEVIERLHQAGIHTGLGAFNPPGTKPPLVGLAVPENFVLPEGYVRHHQATDDGQRIEAILMFAPDRAFFDANHQPIDVPKNRVVPPELAPQGLPIRHVVIPAPVDPGRAGL